VRGEVVKQSPGAVQALDSVMTKDIVWEGRAIVQG
jgi:hypothetical protein